MRTPEESMQVQTLLFLSDQFKYLKGYEVNIVISPSIKLQVGKAVDQQIRDNSVSCILREFILDLGARECIISSGLLNRVFAGDFSYFHNFITNIFPELISVKFM